MTTQISTTTLDRWLEYTEVALAPDLADSHDLYLRRLQAGIQFHLNLAKEESEERRVTA